MALGKSNRVDGKALSLKLATKRDGAFLPRPEWEVSIKQADGEYKTLNNQELVEAVGVEGPLYDVAGDLIGVDTRVGSYEDSPIYNVSLNLRDKDRNEVYFTGFSVGSILGRKLANSVLNLKAFTNVQVGLYNQQNKETKKVYGAAALRQGDDTATVKGKFDVKTDENMQPRVFEGKGGKQERDYTKVDLFLFEQLKAFGEALRANKASNPQPAKEQEESHYAPPADNTPATESTSEGEENGDTKVPF